MIRPLLTSMSLSVVLLGLAPCSPWAFAADDTAQADTNKSDLERFDNKIPFLISHFVSGYQKGYEGCPSVMISNGKSKGVVVWSKSAGEPVKQLVQSIEKWSKPDDHRMTYFILFDKTHEQVAEATKDWDLRETLAGHSRAPSADFFKRLKIDPSIEHLVFMADRRDLKRVWLLKADELSEKKLEEIEAAAEEFLIGKAK